MTDPILVHAGVARGSFRKNYLINGGMDIWQRGTSIAAGTSTRRITDRWYLSSGTSTIAVSRENFAPGQTEVPNNPRYFKRVVVSGSTVDGSYALVAQRVESVRTLAGRKASISFWAKADANKDMSVEFFQDFGSGGTPSSQVLAIGPTKFALTTVWKRFTVAVDIPSISGKTLGTDSDGYLDFRFWLDSSPSFDHRTGGLAAQSGTFDIARVQLEEGPVATEFEQRPIGEELALCKRYFEFVSRRNYSGYFSTSTTARVSVYYSQKRTVPTLTSARTLVQSITSAPDGAQTFGDISDVGARFEVSHSAMSRTAFESGQVLVEITADAEL